MTRFITLDDFTTSANTHDWTVEQERRLLEMAEFFKEDLDKNSAHPLSGNGHQSEFLKSLP